MSRFGLRTGRLFRYIPGGISVKLLVTGGLGFIGSNFVRRVLQRRPEWQVINLDKVTYAGNPENLKDVEDDPRYTFVRGDIADLIKVDEVFRRGGVDAVVSFAAESHVDRSIIDASPFVETNIKGTQVLLDAARRNGVSKFVQVSTDEVYGSLEMDDPPFTESTALAPNSPYAASKSAADLLVRSYCKTYGFPAVITRCSNNYGPYQFPEKLIPLMITNAMEDKPLPVYGDGLNVRDWIHVEDHCAAIEAVLVDGRPGEVYNVGANCEIANVDIVKGVLKVLGKPESLITYVADRRGHDRRYAMDSSKLARELGWAPEYRFWDALPRIVDWYASNEQWWRRIKSGAYMKYYEDMYGHRTAVAVTATGAR
jgi:dTDP-glucose 4,6-dehydratase